MKLSIENFKSIKKLHDFEIKPLTILSGVNSSGKSSFVQLLLLLKQTIKLDSSKEPLVLNGELYKVREFTDIVLNKNTDNKLKFSFQFNKSEIECLNLAVLSIFKTFSEYSCSIEVEIDIKDGKPFVALFSTVFSFKGDKGDQSINVKLDINGKFNIETNTGIFGHELFSENPKILNVAYSSFFPVSYNKYLINILDGVKLLVDSFLQGISYIRPNRQDPKDEYPTSNNPKNVGTRGEFTAQILQDNAKDITNYYEIKNTENGITYIENNKTLIESVKYWMCDIFDIAKDIQAEKINEIYKIFLINKNNLKINIKHVGFGVSQLLPIVVEGLIMSKNGTLIIEQPEIHLHPKLQSKLYDFLYSLTKQGKKVIVETHSSHFITRMRRRIAEDDTNKMEGIIGLTFIEENIFKSIKLDDYGTMNYYPDDFIEESNAELRAIVKAQMIKRKKND